MSLDLLRTPATSFLQHVMDFIRLRNQIKPCTVTVSVANVRANDGRYIGQLSGTESLSQ